MKIGIFVFLTDTSLDVAQLAKRAEELGFDSFWVPDHPIIPVHISSESDAYQLNNAYNRIPDPFLALSRASAVTKTIKLGTGICLIPERNPLMMAKEVATLDHVSGGRFIFGIGAGWLREETEIMGGDFPHRWTQTKDSILAMKELWTKEESEYHGSYYDFPPVNSFPKPIQKPHPPILLGGLAKNVFKRTVEWGDGWLPDTVIPKRIEEGRKTLDELAAQAGRDPKSIEILAFGESGDLRTRQSIKALEEAGADGAVVWLMQDEGDVALIEMEDLAREHL